MFIDNFRIFNRKYKDILLFIIIFVVFFFYRILALYFNFFLNPSNTIIFLISYLLLDVIGFCIQIDQEKLVISQNQLIRKAKMMVDSTLVRN